MNEFGCFKSIILDTPNLTKENLTRINKILDIKLSCMDKEFMDDLKREKIVYEKFNEWLCLLTKQLDEHRRCVEKLEEQVALCVGIDIRMSVIIGLLND